MKRSFTILVALGAAACSVEAPPAPKVPSWDDTQADITVAQDEQELWQEAAEVREKLVEEGSIFVPPVETQAYLNGVLTKMIESPLAKAAPSPSVHILRSVIRSAASMPDGSILISTSTLAVLDNEAQLAAVLGHELGHFISRHQIIDRRYADISRSTVERMQHSREQEVEADQYALRMMRSADYGPRELFSALSLLDSDDTTPVSLYAFRSHPYTAERVRTLQEQINDAPTTNLQVERDRYNEGIAPVLAEAAKVELQAQLLERADAAIERYADLRPDDGMTHFLRAEHIRLTDPAGRKSPRAVAEYERAVELSPNSPEAVRTLGLIYYETDQSKRAAALFEKYLQLAPEAADRKLIQRYLREKRATVR